MSVVEPGAPGVNLIERVKSLLTKPADTWAQIESEPATIGGLYRSWVVPLAAIPAVCGLIGMAVFGVGALGFTYKPPIVSSAANAVVAYGLTLAGVYISALIIDGLAPTFGGTKDKIQSFKVAAYAPTAVWIAGVFQLYPPLAIIAILGALYSLYLLYKGLPLLMKTPPEKALPYTALIVVASIVIGIVVFSVSGAVMRATGVGAMAAHSAGGVLATPGGGSVDLGQLESASKQMEAAAKQMQGGGAAVAATDPELLKAFLPAGIGGFALESTSSGSGGAAGVQGSNAEGVYKKGDAQITVTITDMGAAGALAAMAGAFNVNSSSEGNGRYQKMGKVDGRTTMEEFDSTSGHGAYSVFAGDRFMIHAEGEKATIGELKAAVAAVNPVRLEGLAKKG